MKLEIQISKNKKNKFTITLSNMLHYGRKTICTLINSLLFYTKRQSPCLTCSVAEDINSCRIYGERCDKCSLYVRWLKFKKNSHNTIQTEPKFLNINKEYLNKKWIVQ